MRLRKARPVPANPVEAARAVRLAELHAALGASDVALLRKIEERGEADLDALRLYRIQLRELIARVESNSDGSDVRVPDLPQRP